MIEVGLLIVLLMCLVFSVLAYARARSVDDFASSTHTRVNNLRPEFMRDNLKDVMRQLNYHKTAEEVLSRDLTDLRVMVNDLPQVTTDMIEAAAKDVKVAYRAKIDTEMKYLRDFVFTPLWRRVDLLQEQIQALAKANGIALEYVPEQPATTTTPVVPAHYVTTKVRKLKP